MSPQDAERWKLKLLDELFVALAASEELTSALVFKGRRILNYYLAVQRQSLDLDSNLTHESLKRFPDHELRQKFLEEEMKIAIRKHFESQDPVRYELTTLRAHPKPPRGHPRGWDAFEVRINIDDLGSSAKGLPALEIDVAAPEHLLNTSVQTIQIGGHPVLAYTLERIAGEKLRAFLSSLPRYRRKIERKGDAIRARDLYDLAHIRRARPLADSAFWQVAGEEFRLACQSRYIDCDGLATFQEAWEVTRKTYEQAIIPKDVPFAEAEESLIEIVHYLAAHGFLPLSCPLPDETQESGKSQVGA